MCGRSLRCWRHDADTNRSAETGYKRRDSDRGTRSGFGPDLASNRRKMGNELITEHDERIRSYFQTLERLSKALETLFSKRKSSLDGESFYTDEELSQRLKISRRSLQDYRNQGRIPYIKLGGKILYRSSDVERMLEEGYRNEFR